MYGCASREIGLNSENLGGALIVTVCVRKYLEENTRREYASPTLPCYIQSRAQFFRQLVSGGVYSIYSPRRTE